MIELKCRVRGLLAEGRLHLPFPGQGTTAARLGALTEFARRDLSLARIVEAHTDAMAILAESSEAEGSTPAKSPHAERHTLYGVWASDGPHSRLTATEHLSGRWLLAGTKQYCGGSSWVDAALITAHSESGVQLFDVPMSTPGITILPSTWATSALADTDTGPVQFHDVELPKESRVGITNWYLQRPGFWHGALAPAACWAGGALSLVDAVANARKKGAHALAHLGALQSIAWGFEAVLQLGAQQIDADPADLQGQARVRALKIRHLVERWCTEVMDRFGRATGPALLAHDPQIIRQFAALALYIRQCHAEHDLETIPEAESPGRSAD